MTILDHFPEGFKPSNSQQYILDQIDVAFNEGHKFVIVCAPTGSGKSFISKTLSNLSNKPSTFFKDNVLNSRAFERDQLTSKYMLEDEYKQEKPFGAFALTITKSLQDQYKELFDDSNVLKGKMNYRCMIDERYSCQVAPCIFDSTQKGKCLLDKCCPYYENRKETLVSQFGVLNYSMFLSLPEHLKRKEYIVCDEASEVEDELVKRFSRTLPFKLLKKLGYDQKDIPINNYFQFKVWLNELNDKVFTELEKIKRDMKKNSKGGGIQQLDQNKYILFSTVQMQMEATLDTWDQCEYIVESDLNGINITPYKIDTLAKHLFDFGEKIVLMSATIIDPDNFAKTLGIKKFKYIEAPSQFDPKKAPIYVNSNNRLNHSNLKERLPYILEEILKIVEHHKNDKGIIHTHTMQITEYLREHIDDDRFLFRFPGQENDKIIKEHMESSRPTILVSPSMAFGVDLKGDLAKFQVVVKAAYLPLGVERIKRLFKYDPDWYMNKMLNSLIQSCGRGVRTITDECVTYILDTSIYDCILKAKHKLPEYFKKRFV